MKKRVLIFSSAYLPFVGGAELAIKKITERIDNYDFDLITLRFDSALPKFEKIGNVSVYRIGFSLSNPKMSDLLKWPLRLNKLLFPFMAPLKAASLNKKNNYDIIWAMMAAFAGFAALNYKLLNPRLKYLLSLQEGDPIEDIKKKVRFVYPLFKMIFTKADHIQVISSHLKSFALMMGYKGELSIVPNAVDIERFSREQDPDELASLSKKLGKNDGDIFLIHVGRSVIKNDLESVIRSLKYLPRNIKFLMLGVGPDDDKLTRLVSDLDLGSRVIRAGNIDHDEVVKYLCLSDIFIRPSLSEGLGNSFLEAMLVGIPVIATPVGGIVDFLIDDGTTTTDKQTGYFCELRNPQSIAKQVNRIRGDENKAKEVVANAKKMVLSDYDWRKISEKMEKILSKITTNGI